MRGWEKDENDGFYRLVCGILGLAPGDSLMKNLVFEMSLSGRDLDCN